MPRSQAQSDFSVCRVPEIELPATAGPVALPDADAVTGQASALANRWLMRLTLALMVVLFLLCAVGLHIPSGG